jgi:acyl-CoA synthetase (AMP-forming)/AMP-acid ligase II
MTEPIWSIPDLLAAHGPREFVVTDDGAYSFATIDDRARRFATRLRDDHGIMPGDHVAILAGNHAGFIVAWFGIVMAGAVAATLNNQLIAEGLRYTVRQSAARLIVADRAWMDHGHHHLTDDLAALPLIVIEDERDFLGSLDAFAPGQPAPIARGDTMTILYTSGTTGLPKGVMNSHAAYAASGAQAARLLSLTPDDRLMVFLPMFHVNPQMMGVMSVLTVGACIVLRPRFSASTFFDDAKAFGATGCTYVGTILAMLVNRYPGEQRDHAMRFCFGGGAPKDVWRAVEDRFGIRVHESYGMTEIGGWTSSNTIAAPRFGSTGFVRDDIEVRIVDRHDNPVPPGTRGEIVARPRVNDVILQGYWEKPEKFVESLGNLWFHSGDSGSIDADGYLFYHGRLKELIRRGGEMVSPIEVETRLMTMPGVADCAIVGVPDPVMDEEIKAVVVRGDAAIEPAAVRHFLGEHFPAYMLPRYVEFTEAIPKTETQKVQRNLLQHIDGAVVDLRK